MNLIFRSLNISCLHEQNMFNTWNIQVSKKVKDSKYERMEGDFDYDFHEAEWSPTSRCETFNSGFNYLETFCNTCKNISDPLYVICNPWEILISNAQYTITIQFYLVFHCITVVTFA